MIQNSGLYKRIKKEVSILQDFVKAAFPWVVMGVFVAIVTAHMSSKEK